MVSTTRHVTRCMVAGIVALLPLGGAVLTLVWLESSISAGWLARAPFYFPGLGLLLALGVVYATGFAVTTFVGRYLWRRLDRLLERLPLLGQLYQSLKEVLGYDSGRDRFFLGAVQVPVEGGSELGLVTGELTGTDGEPQTLVFVPGSPNPVNGRLLVVPSGRVQALPARTADVLRALVSMGKTPVLSGQRAEE